MPTSNTAVEILMSLIGTVNFTELIQTTINAIVAIGLMVWASVFLYKELRRNNLPKEFEIFLNTSFPKNPNHTAISTKNSIDEFEKNMPGEPIYKQGNFAIHASSLFKGAVEQSVQASQHPDLEISSMKFPVSIDLRNVSQKEEEIYATGPHKGKRLLFPHIFDIKFQKSEIKNSWTPIIIKNARIHRVIFEKEFADLVIFQNCWISLIEIEKRDCNYAIQLDLLNCLVGTLKLGENSCSTLSVHGGAINQIYSPLSTEKSPILHALTFESKTILNSNSNNLPSENSHYRNFSLHAKNRSDPLTQQIINAVIYRAERNEEKGFMRAMNFCYQLFSNYNIRPGRPLLWILFSILTCMYLVYISNSAVLIRHCGPQSSSAISFIDALCGSGEKANLYRTITLVFNSLISPLSALSDKSLIYASTLPAQLLLNLVGLLNLVWATLAIFSVKIRFSSKSSKSD